MNQPNSQERLIALVTERQLAEPTPDDVRELEELLQSASARRLYIELINLQGHLETLLTRRTTEEIVHQLDADEIFAVLRQAEEAAPDIAAWQTNDIHLGPAKSEGEPALMWSDTASAASYLLRQQVKKHRVFLGSMAAMLIVGVVLVLSLLGGPDETNQTDPLALTPQDEPAAIAKAPAVATLTAVTDARWQAESGTTLPGVGDELRAGDRLTLTAGFAEITTHRGAIAIIEAPATIELIDNDNAVRLHAGKLVGICETESAKGFLVRTPHMDVIDLGTRFGVDVVRGLATEVHVHQGEVVVAPTNAPASTSTQKQIIIANQAVRSVDAGRAIAAITPDFAKFDGSLRTYLLPGTGVGLAIGETDPNWRIVAIDNKSLDRPLSLRVSDLGFYTDGQPNDRATGQWLSIHPRDLPEGVQQGERYTVEHVISIPDTIDLNRSTLHLDSRFDNQLAAMRINGQEIEIPDHRPIGFLHHFTRRDSPASLGLTHGNNTVEFEILEIDPDTATALFLTWHIDTNPPDQP